MVHMRQQRLLGFTIQSERQGCFTCVQACVGKYFVCLCIDTDLPDTGKSPQICTQQQLLEEVFESAVLACNVEVDHEPYLFIASSSMHPCLGSSLAHSVQAR